MRDKDIKNPDLVEFFECDCHDKDHLIRAEYSEYTFDYKDGTSHIDRDLNINFTVCNGDWESTGYKDSFLEIKWSKFVWRIKNASKILFTGSISVDGYFIPCRSLVSSKDNTIERLFGYETVKKLANWLNVMADKIKKDYEDDVVKYGQEVTKKITI